MEPLLLLEDLTEYGMEWAAAMCQRHHYLHKMVDRRTMPFGYKIRVGVDGLGMQAGLLLFGRPEATRCRDWYGSVAEKITGRVAVTRWQVLNLSRVLLLPHFQAGGAYCQPGVVPGFVDRRGVWRSSLASTAIRMAMQRIGFDYLLAVPPVFPDEPFNIRWLMSYCDTRLHKGTIYQASGFERYETGNPHIQTWRTRLPDLTHEQTDQVLHACRISPRSQRIRAERAQLQLDL